MEGEALGGWEKGERGGGDECWGEAGGRRQEAPVVWARHHLSRHGGNNKCLQ